MRNGQMPLGRRAPLALALLALTVSFPAVVAAAETGFTNTRAFFDVGSSWPVGFGNFDRGFGLGFGLEMEDSPTVSALFRVEWNQWEAKSSAILTPHFTYAPIRRRAINWSLGARFHVPQGRVLRPYSEVLFGVRLVDETSDEIRLLSDGTGEPGPKAQGLVTTVRLGISMGRRGGTAFFLDAGFESPVETPRRYGIVPVRVGVQLP